MREQNAWFADQELPGPSAHPLLAPLTQDSTDSLMLDDAFETVTTTERNITLLLAVQY
jgi:hypothetical protein